MGARKQSVTGRPASSCARMAPASRRCRFGPAADPDGGPCGGGGARAPRPTLTVAPASVEEHGTVVNPAWQSMRGRKTAQRKGRRLGTRGRRKKIQCRRAVKHLQEGCKTSAVQPYSRRPTRVQVRDPTACDDARGQQLIGPLARLGSRRDEDARGSSRGVDTDAPPGSYLRRGRRSVPSPSSAAVSRSGRSVMASAKTPVLRTH
uniref:Uncharacterized protein n=1 Tax=Setaria italica TaxID=4555 RepID=K3XM42_SETIT